MRISDGSSDVCSSDLLSGVIGNTPVFDSAAWTVEMTWNTYTHVRSGEALFNAKGYASCAGKDKWDGCSTKQAVAAGLNFTPTWYQVLPSVDLLLPVSISDRKSTRLNSSH